MIKKLFYFTLILLTLCMVTLLTLIYISIENTAAVGASRPVSEHDIEKIRQLISENKPAAVLSRSKVKLEVSNDEANEVLKFANQYYERNLRAKTKFLNNKIYTQFSYQLPSNPVGRFVNVGMMLKVHYGKYFIIEELKVGHLAVPSFILKAIEPLIISFAKKYYGSYFVLWKHIKRIDVYNSTLSIHYQIKRGDLNKLKNMARKILVDDVMRERVSAYEVEMHKILNRLDPGRQSIVNVLSPLFWFAEKRSLENNQTVDENRMALLTLSAYMAGKNPMSYIEDKAVKKFRKINFTLKNRSDLAKHYAITAGLNAIADKNWANAIGLRKELKDSNGGSGFSFVDLMADMAGNKLAEVLLSPSAHTAQLKLKELDSEDGIMGDIEGLQEGLSSAEFRMQFGNTSSEEYVRIIRELRRRLLTCSVYHRL